MTYLLRVLALLTVAPVIAHAQLAQSRQGFGMSLGVYRVTDFGLSGQVCEFSAGIKGGGAYLRMGGHSRPSLFAGVELNATVQTHGCRGDLFLLSAAFVVQWYPRVASGFYLKGGAGPAVVTNGDDYGPGVSLNLGLGYDVRLSRTFSLSPQANYVRTIDYTDAVQLGVGLTWH